MLRQLAGRAHEVMTGIALVCGGTAHDEVAITRVTFHPLSADEIAWYVASGEPDDKAGAYAIQGLAARFVARLEGSYSNVVGLPVDVVYRQLRTLGAALDPAGETAGHPGPGAIVGTGGKRHNAG